MKLILLLVPLLAMDASAGEPATALQAQPLVQVPTAAPAARAGARTDAAGRGVVGPKIHETVATRNADGRLEIGCVERPNPRAAKPPIRTVVPAANQ